MSTNNKTKPKYLIELERIAQAAFDEAWYPHGADWEHLTDAERERFTFVLRSISEGEMIAYQQYSLDTMKEAETIKVELEQLDARMKDEKDTLEDVEVESLTNQMRRLLEESEDRERRLIFWKLRHYVKPPDWLKALWLPYSGPVRQDPMIGIPIPLRRDLMAAIDEKLIAGGKFVFKQLAKGDGDVEHIAPKSSPAAE